MLNGEKQAAKKESALEPGAMVDHYRIIRPLGAGGMAEVYLARDTMLGRKVALKVVQPKRLAKKDSVKRFLFEAKATARFNHPHIVTIYNVGMASGNPYLALEYLEGQTLRERLEQERLSVKEAIRIAKAIADALITSHKKKILHRDLKPGNVMLARDGRLRVLDFGLSQLHNDPDAMADSSDAELSDLLNSQSRFTLQRAEIKGTPAYIAPEQWKDETIGPHTDVWALGLILYEMLVGCHPYKEVGSMHELATSVTSVEPVPLPDFQGRIPFDLVALLEQSLEKEPNRRPTAFEVGQELERLLQGKNQEDLIGMNPFRGLSSFEEEHSHLYFGREAEINSFVERLRYEPVLPIVGISGAGKSSFVKAGVIPRLREKGPLILLQIRPGLDPFFALASSLVKALYQSTSSMTSSGGPLGRMTSRKIAQEQVMERSIDEVHDLAKQLFAKPQSLSLWLNRLAEQYRVYVVLFVDQLEELCAIDRKDELQQNSTDIILSKSSEEISLSKADVSTRFMQAIAGAADDPQLPVRVVITVREEFLTRLLTGVLARETLNRFAILRKPSSATLVDILKRSVQAVGYKFEDYLLPSHLVNDVRKVQACFPSLQFACEILWQNRDKQRRIITRAAYEEMGGVAGALVQHAEGVLKGLSVEEISIAKSILLQLITEDKTRRIINRKSLLEGLDVRAEQVLDLLIESRLIIISRNYPYEDQDDSGQQTTSVQLEGDCELAHEALINQWETLERWIDENRDQVKLLRQLEQAAELWDKRGRRIDELWGPQALKEAQIAIGQNLESNQLMRDFIRASERCIRKGNLRRIAVFGVILIVLISSVWVGNHLLRGKLCTGAQEEIASVLNPQVRESISKAFLETGISFAKDTVGKIHKLLDDYAAEWETHYTKACEATHVKGEQSEEVLDLRMNCLKKRLAEFGALLRVFARADKRIVQNAIQASTGLTSISTCANEEELRTSYPPPKKNGSIKKLTTMRDKLAHVEALSKTGKYRTGLEIARRLTEETEAIGYRPVQAESYFWFGDFLEKIGNYAKAEEVLQKAALLAAKSGDAFLTIKAMTQLVLVVGSRQARIDAGSSIARDAGMMLELSGRNELIRAMLINNLGSMFYYKGDYTKALKHFNQALLIREKELGTEHPSVSSSLSNVGDVYRKQGEYDKALLYLQKSLSIDEKLLGPAHPNVAMTLNNMGGLFARDKQYDKALDFFHRALDIKERALGTGHPKLASTLSNIGGVLALQGKYDEAFEQIHKSLVIREKALGPKNPLLASPLSQIGAVLIQKEKIKEAQQYFRRVVSLCEKKDCEPGSYGNALFGLARVLVLTGGDKKSSRRLAKTALERFETNPKVFRKRIKEINTWLQKHGASKLTKKAVK